MLERHADLIREIGHATVSPGQEPPRVPRVRRPRPRRTPRCPADPKTPVGRGSPSRPCSSWRIARGCHGCCSLSSAHTGDRLTVGSLERQFPRGLLLPPREDPQRSGEHTAALRDREELDPGVSSKRDPWVRASSSANCVLFSRSTSTADIMGSTDEAALAEYFNHEASSHVPDVARRFQLLRKAATTSLEARKHRCSSTWLRRQFSEQFPQFVSKKASQRVLVAEEWPMLTVTSLPDDIVHHAEDRIPNGSGGCASPDLPRLVRVQGCPHDWC